MITEILTTEEIKAIWSEIFLNKTSKVSDISDESTFSAIAYGTAKIAQKAIKDIAIVEGHIFPESAYGDYLDRSADLFGVPARLGASQSSTYVYVNAEPGTIYGAGVNVFKSNTGISFDIEEDYTVDDTGLGYVKVRSQETGSKSNVPPNSIIFINPTPSGHLASTNEYIATGGRDSESDQDFRNRIKQHPNLVARNTIEYLTQIAISFNSDVLRLDNLGVSDSGKINIAVISQNGVDFSESELEQLLTDLTPYFSITDLSQIGGVVGVELINATWFVVNGSTGIDFRVDLYQNYNPDTVRKNMQVAISKYLDFRYWDNTKKIEWDEILSIVKNTDGVKYVPDTYFNPNQDITVPLNQYPRIQRFVMRDLDGNVISDVNGVLTPVFYP